MTAQDPQTPSGSTERPNGPSPDPVPSAPRRLAHRARAWRHGLRASPTADRVYRLVVGVVGGGVVLLGLAFIPLPGPGWLIVFAGLAILATEFEAADRLYRFVRERVKAWTHWLARQALLVRIVAGLLSLAVVALVVYLSLLSFGVPGWVPESLFGWLPGIGG